MSTEWPSIFLSALASGMLSLVISHVYYRVNLTSAEKHHDAQMRAMGKRHVEQMEKMTNHHAEQLLVLRTTLLAVERDSGVEAARDEHGKLTGGLHHDGQFIAVPDVSPTAVAEHVPSPSKDHEK